MKYLAAVTVLLLSVPAAPVWAEKPLPPAFGVDLKPEGKANDESADPVGAGDLGERKAKRAAPPARHGARGRGGKVRIQLDGDEDGGGSEFEGESGSDPDAGDF